eukprot:CAMPEP_0175069916 /NCGR_PEP_ID=MMETSP0052_2-20121109/18442_1 /TAXON_ID=51329 ORGANISM="Polytomella parva, Strain SAG 63-3" /NCGR_SAMPLE_ID=MMETSP0052_2 /ASSEMBLY_ACC=CAM_ASM_000194 /LENGTH=61 /DNA_ID=CAMNT_0016337007 /DNA_START=67 /DNA_END=254 /DNA_ORIENTATION=-
MRDEGRKGRSVGVGRNDIGGRRTRTVDGARVVVEGGPDSADNEDVEDSEDVEDVEDSEDGD